MSTLNFSYKFLTGQIYGGGTCLSWAKATYPKIQWKTEKTRTAMVSMKYCECTDPPVM
jgi:hypothetical protein